MTRIGILTSGGDAPGMNAAIRAIVRTCYNEGVEVYGIYNGYHGLVNDRIKKLERSSVSGIIQRGGTILGTARSEEFRTDEGLESALENLKKHQIDAIIILGGDGTFMGAKELHNKGIKTIGIPCTIDNDMGYTELTVGFTTAVETALEAVSKLRDTSDSHGRCNIIEVMGRNCGDIALYAGLAGGAETILVPEVEFELGEIVKKMHNSRAKGKRHHIIVMAEGIDESANLKNEIQEKTGIETRLTILGHVQRGGEPALNDKVMASVMGVRAVELIIEGKSGLALGNKGEDIFTMEIEEAVGVKKEFDFDVYQSFEKLSI